MLRFVVIAGLLMSGALVASISQLPVRSLAQPNVTTSRAPNADTVDDTLEKLKALLDQHKPPFAYGPIVDPLTSPPAYARDWFAVNLDGNACQTMHQFGEETMQLGGMPTFSPADMVFWLRRNGVSPHTEVTNFPNGVTMAEVSWRSDQETNLYRIFFTSMAYCQNVVAHMIKDGIVAAPGALR